MLGMIIAFVALAAAAPTYEPFDLLKTYNFAGLPNVELKYYDVHGSNIDEITESFRAGERPISGPGLLHAGRTDVTVSWRIYHLITGRTCRIPKVDISYRATIFLPRLVHPELLDPSTRMRVERFISAVRNHEAGHAHNRFDHLGETRAAVLRAGCAGAEAAMRAAQERDIALDRRYEADTQDGRLQGAVY
jgi:predicted secreted Zn-dependent protease